MECCSGRANWAFFEESASRDRGSLVGVVVVEDRGGGDRGVYEILDMLCAS
jgi:hypothetical protein